MKGQHLKFIIGCLLSAFFLWLALRKVDFKTLWQTLAAINYWWTIPFVIITLLSMYVRALRWHYLLLPNYRVPPMRLFSPLMIGFAFNGIFPARAGEFARAYVVAKKENTTFSAAFATVVLERVFDAATNILCFLVALLLLPAFDPEISFIWNTQREITGSTILTILNISLISVFIILAVALLILATKPSSQNSNSIGSQTQSRSTGRLSSKLILSIRSTRNARAISATLGITLTVTLATLLYLNIVRPIGEAAKFSFGRQYLFDGNMLQDLSRKTALFIFILLIILILLMLKRTREMAKQVLARMIFIPQKLRLRVAEIVDSFARGLSSLQDIRALAFIIFYSLIVWLTVGLSVWIMSFGFPQLEMTFPQAVAIVVIICIAILIPAAPGYWGLYELGCIFALRVLNITSDWAVALGFSLIIHFLQMFPIVAIGLIYAWREHVSLSKIRGQGVQN